jgi:hypothetical protein
MTFRKQVYKMKNSFIRDLFSLYIVYINLYIKEAKDFYVYVMNYKSYKEKRKKEKIDITNAALALVLANKINENIKRKNELEK